MKKIFFILIITLAGNFVYAQTGTGSAATPLSTLYEWNVGNTGTSPGERIVAYINSGTIGSYMGCQIYGQLEDGNGNWGSTLPTVANFKLYVNFTNNLYSLSQDVATANVTLELKSISATQSALVANGLANRQIRVLLRVSSGSATITLGDPLTVNSTGTTMISQPTYQSNLTGSLFLNVTNLTGAAGYTLAVGGSAIATSMTVKLQGNWPDYVFKPTYHLPLLSELKTYIDKNHHLPEIPSAQEIAKDGLNLGEMNKVLVKKAEELTLYLIEKDHKQQDDENAIKTQQEEINQLKQQVQLLIKASNKN
jgi:hypothetical protein